MYITGIAGFALVYIKDFNDYKLHNSKLNVLFWIGFCLIALATIGLILNGNTVPCQILAARVAVMVLAIISLAGLIVSLFFSFDKDEAYGNSGADGRRRVYTRKLYALCRHPGVLFFALLYICLWLISPLPLAAAALFSVLNIGLAAFEDLFVFPAMLEGYDDYKKETPFLLPSGRSVSRCINDFRRP